MRTSEMSEVTRYARKLALRLKWRAEGDSVTPEERAEIDRVLKWAGIVRTAEAIPQCYGSEDEHGRPTCDGTPVRKVTFNPPKGGVISGPMGTDWCDACRAIAIADGYEILTVGEPLPPKPTDYPCRNARNGCKRRVTRESESCTPSCGWESIGECAEHSR